MIDRLDILIPYWGDPALLRETVDSVLAQEDPRWRLTVIDDNYPGTAAREMLAAIDDERVRYIRKDANEGIIANFRSCVEVAEAPIMAMPGCDDRLLPGYVGEILATAELFPLAAVIQPGVRVIDEDGEPARTLPDLVKDRVVKPSGRGRQVLAGERLAVSLLHGDWLYWPSLAFRTDRIKAVPFRDEYPIILDLALVLDMVFDGDMLVSTPAEVFEYRRHGSSLSSEKLTDGSRFDDERDYFRGAAAQAQALGWHRAARAARWHLTSRAYAALTLPRALRGRDRDGVRALARHVLTV
ncbi:glycosyltransferase family 2 protein [Brachybacterium nesterenkovii]|uniref:Glycosyl transferase, family 2 n=1 Tax=Brachybacterium nesterenkovii TaxID=47847 RepID=A0A1X6WTS1_9MICO|nr:glycosyltransferase family 2 protein [Brachybacterium nesterenkovii]SLM88499.1 glycosyl transferase, family 2 [Brachybacterium nesterenkovii]